MRFLKMLNIRLNRLKSGSYCFYGTQVKDVFKTCMGLKTSLTQVGQFYSIVSFNYNWLHGAVCSRGCQSAETIV